MGEAITAVMEGERAFCKFLAANDTRASGAHQSGFYMPKTAVPIMFDAPCERGANDERWVDIDWAGGFRTHSRFIYYGQKTRNEYRLTHFGRGFPFLDASYTGALFVLVEFDRESYKAFILNTDDEIEEFLSAFALTPEQTGRLIDTADATETSQERETRAFDAFIQGLTSDFPTSAVMSAAARSIQDDLYNHRELIETNPDQKLLDWTNIEYRLFKALEYARYEPFLKGGFSSVDLFVEKANQVLNRRKSRAGKSLENHLEALFTGNSLDFEAQATTEGNKRPDFLFPSSAAYHDSAFPTERLITLAAKTTCKDRWRQILNEADRLKGRPLYLCTLQQGVSQAQMDEMTAEHVTLVVPKPYFTAFPRDRRDRLMSLHQFVHLVKNK